MLRCVTEQGVICHLNPESAIHHAGQAATGASKRIKTKQVFGDKTLIFSDCALNRGVGFCRCTGGGDVFISSHVLRGACFPTHVAGVERVQRPPLENTELHVVVSAFVSLMSHLLW